MAPSAIKYPVCNHNPNSLSPPSKPVNIINVTAEPKHHPDQQYTASLLYDLQWSTLNLALLANLHPEGI